MLLLESALDDEAVVAVDRASGSELREQELQHVFVLPLHQFADLREVRERRLLAACSLHLENQTIQFPVFKNQE